MGFEPDVNSETDVGLGQRCPARYLIIVVIGEPLGPPGGGGTRCQCPLSRQSVEELLYQTARIIHSRPGRFMIDGMQATRIKEIVHEIKRNSNFTVEIFPKRFIFLFRS